MQSICSTTTTSTCSSSTWTSLRLVFRKLLRQASRPNAYNVAPQHQQLSRPMLNDDKFEMHPARSRTPVLHVQEQSLEDRYGTPQTFPGITRVNLHTKMAEMSQRIAASTWFQRFLWPPSSARSTLCFTTPTRWHRNAYFISSDSSYQRQPRQDLL